MAEMLQKAGSLVKAANIVEKGSSSEAPSSVMVAVRCRPMNKRELDQKEAKIITMKEDGYAAIQPPEEGAAPREFSFDYTYDDDSIQQTVYDNLGAPLLNKAFEGWNGTIFAYGQTGTGKTFTMEGVNHDEQLKGIIPRAFSQIFDMINTSADPNVEFLVRASYLEIYNEEIRDLLSKNTSNKLELKENPDSGVYVRDLTSYVVKSTRECDKLRDFGAKNRHVGATAMNQDSSRSHSIYTITVESCEVRASSPVPMPLPAPAPSLSKVPASICAGHRDPSRETRLVRPVS